jgi:hypothetical protein
MLLVDMDDAADVRLDLLYADGAHDRSPAWYTEPRLIVEARGFGSVQNY